MKEKLKQGKGMKVLPKEEKKEKLKEYKISEDVRQNRAGIVIGILGVLVAIFAGVLALAMGCMKDLNIPIGSVFYILSYLAMSMLMGCLVIIIFYAVIFLLFEVKRNDVTGKDTEFELRTDAIYHNFFVAVSISLITFLIAIMMLAVTFYRKNVIMEIMVIIPSIILMGFSISYLFKNVNGLSFIEIRDAVLKIVIPLLLFVMIFMYYFISKNYLNNSKLSVNFNENGMIQIHKDSLDADGLDVEITYGQENGEEKFFLWNNKSLLISRLDGYSGIFEAVNDAEADISDAGNAIWGKTKKYSHYELNLNDLTNQIEGREEEKIGERSGEYIITIMVNQKERKVVSKNRFKVIDGKRYIFATDKVEIEY